MGRAPCCSKVGLHKGPWSALEDDLLIKYIEAHGEGQWRSLPKNAGLLRCGKSCRLRWVNYLKPDIKRGNFTPEEDDLIIRLHALVGNRWSHIAGKLPGRTDNEIKNYWNTHLVKRLQVQETEPNAYNKKGSKKPRSRNKQRADKVINHVVQGVVAEDADQIINNDHFPEPVTVTPPVVSLTRNRSIMSFDTSLSTNTMCTTTTSASSSQIQSPNSSQDMIFDPDHITLDGPWLSNNVNNMVEKDGFDDYYSMNMMGLWGDYQENNMQFEELYEEYLHLIKQDHGLIGDKTDN